LGGLVLYGLASVACAFAYDIASLLVGRTVQAVGACCGPVLARAVVRDLYARDDAARVLAFMGAAMGLIPAAAPILGGQVEIIVGWRGNFFALFGFGVLVLLATFFFLAETNRECDPMALHPVRMARNYAELIGHRVYVGFMLAVAFAFGGLFAFISGSPFVLIGVYGVGPDEFGFFFSGGVIGFISGSLITARLGKRIGLERTLKLGAGIAAIGAAAILAVAFFGPRTGHFAALLMVGGMIIYLTGFGMVMPNGYAGAISPFPRKAGAAAALVGCVQMATAALFGALVGAWHDGTPEPMAIVIALSTAGTLGAAFGLVPRTARPSVP
jgi:DHA1 family bicyclomycin/chloramphenicol resistance-like MFS transporter